MSVILITSDLMVISHVQGAAAKTGVAVHVFSDAQQAAANVGSEGRHVIIDLATATLDLAALVRECRTNASPPRIIAFVPHVHEARLDAARQAGCDTVMSRGQFFSQVHAILSG